MIAATALATLINMYGSRALAWAELIMFACQILGFFAVLIPLWAMGKKSSADEVFFTFQDNSSWGSMGTACLVGLLGPTATLVGGDCAAHLTEETKDASRAVPLAMTITAVFNYSIGFIMTLTILFFSQNPSQTITDQTGQSYIAAIFGATQSRTATMVLTILVIVLFFCCILNSVTAASRQLFAFARDGGIPYSTYHTKVCANRT